MNKLAILVLSMFLLTTVSALDIRSSYDTNILLTEVDSQIELTLELSNITPGRYNVYTLADIDLSPSNEFLINSDEFKQTFTLKPTQNLDVEGYYTFAYIINQRGVEKFEQKFTANILKLEDIIEISSDSIDINSNEISFYVQNKENVELKDLRATFSSVVFDTVQTFDLKPFEKKFITVVADGYKLKKTKAGVYIIEGLFETREGIKKIEGTLFLGEKKGITTTENSAGILINKRTITKVNAGNVFEAVEIKMQKNLITRLFTTFSVEPTIIERNGFIITYTWLKAKLGPAEAVTIESKTNYLFPFLIVVLAVIALMGLKRYGDSHLIIKKSVSHVKTKGGEFALRITLSAKATKSIGNVTLIDKVPRIVKIYKEFGNIKPDKIDPTTRRIHWHLGGLDSGEERILTYVVYSKVGVVGKFSLPRATAVFEREDKIHEVESNNVFFMSDQVEND